MGALNAVSAVIEWGTRLLIPVLCALLATASALTAVYVGVHGHWVLALGLAMVAASAGTTAGALTVGAIRRIRQGPTPPPIRRQ